MGQFVRTASINELSGSAFTVAPFIRKLNRITTASEEEWKRKGPVLRRLLCRRELALPGRYNGKGEIILIRFHTLNKYAILPSGIKTLKGGT